MAEQVVESATAITSTLIGDQLQVASDMDTYSRRLPLGVCAAITPFNFPAMSASSILTVALLIRNVQDRPMVGSVSNRHWEHTHCQAL